MPGKTQDLKQCFGFVFFFFNVYLFILRERERERENAHMQVGEGQRQNPIAGSRLSAEPDMGLDLKTEPKSRVGPLTN